ncbi:MAG: ATP-binding cassette domain-containing protein [Lachnospiraceae bacterium]|nr:ATP-binding cassette domain-containing protein [Lachnospiraceae bacterium]
MPEKIFIARKLTKKYKTYALNQFDMEICRGDIYGFIGRNGAGKTTLMRILTGRAAQSGGDICLFGESNPDKLYLQRRRVGAIIEGPAFYPGMTAEDNLEVVRLQHGIKEKKCIKELLKIAGLEDTGSKKAGNFSLGMKQRLGIAMALIGRPELLVLDEPVNGLDPEGILQLRELIKKLNKEQGITVLISSHILSELDQLATCYGFIDKGKMKEQIQADGLIAKCKPYLSIRAGNVQNTAEVLKRMFPDNELEIVSESRVNLYGFTGSTKELIKELVLNEADVKEIKAEGKSLERYYMSLVNKGR